MITLWKLLNIEMKRLAIPFVIMAFLVTAVQLFGVHAMANYTVNDAERIMKHERLASFEQFANSEPLVSFADAVKFDPKWTTVSVGICIAFMFFYLLFIWYRDFLGKHPFMNRLLLIPAARHNIFFAKLIAPLLVIFALLAVQMVLLPIEYGYYYALLPAELRADTPLTFVISADPALRTVIPLSVEQFAVYYGIGIAAIIVLYTGVILERSFRLRGLFGALVYGAVVLYTAFIPLWLGDEWYEYEKIRMLAAIVTGMGALSLWFSLYLLKRKITV